MTLPTPDWDLEQLEVILDDPGSWQFVVAGPGAGKSAVACQRVASLVDDGIPPSRILLVSFTRTAVAELRDRIVSYAMAGERARSVRISTIDSHAWSLRAGFEDEPLSESRGNDSYDMSVSRAVDLFRSQQPDLLDFMGRVEHLIIDEAQDVVGVRVDLVIEMLRSLSEECGVTILADPAQAIYGFTGDDSEDGDEGGSLLSRLETESPRGLVKRQLEQIHRIQDQQLLDVFQRTRREVEQQHGAEEHVNRVKTVICETALENLGSASYETIAARLSNLQDESVLVLFRRRADVLIASSYCSGAGVQHRLRMSGVPTIVKPWLGWLFAEFDKALITNQEFDTLWAERMAISPAPLEGEQKENAWALLHKLAAGQMSGVVDMVHLRSILSRSRPPVEVCLPDLGVVGPILGTIHASKGREADTVVLVMPPAHYREPDASHESVLEEGRVYYVGATRARRALVVASNIGPRVSYLESRRVYRRLPQHGNPLPRVQLEIGRDGDVDPIAHLSWRSAVKLQQVLAMSAGLNLPLQAISSPTYDFVPRLILGDQPSLGVTEEIEVGQMGESFKADLNRVWSLVDTHRRFRPSPRIQHLYLVGVTSVVLSDNERAAVPPPFSKSGFALAPVVKGFPMVRFLHQKKGRRY